MEEWTVDKDQVGERADLYVADKLGGSRAEAQRLLEHGDALINGKITRSSYKMRASDTVCAIRPEPIPATAVAEDIPLDVAYEDQDILVIRKPRGMVVHPAPGHYTGTLVNAVLAHSDDLSGIGGELRPGIVHRLDRDTSGLLVVAKNDTAHYSLQSQIQAKTAQRHYQAVLWGQPKFEEAKVDAPIGRNPSDRKKMAVIQSGGHTARQAVTKLIVLERLGSFCFVEAQLQTGRTHQIRVHCAWIGHPVVGDPLYGGERGTPITGLRTEQRHALEEAIRELNGQALNAFSLTFNHPRTGELMHFKAPMPAVMQNLLDILRLLYTEPEIQAGEISPHAE